MFKSQSFADVPAGSLMDIPIRVRWIYGLRVWVIAGILVQLIHLYDTKKTQHNGKESENFDTFARNFSSGKISLANVYAWKFL